MIDLSVSGIGFHKNGTKTLFLANHYFPDVTGNETWTGGKISNKFFFFNKIDEIK
jgi:hypothetical protein